MAEPLARVDDRRMGYMRGLFGAFCTDDEEVEVRSFLAFALWIGGEYIQAGHGARSRADVVAIVVRRLLEEPS